jgi:hypothetical protein
MQDPAEPAEPDEPVLRKPRRGALPTPRSELEKAQPFVPGRAETGDQGEDDRAEQAGSDDAGDG